MQNYSIAFQELDRVSGKQVIAFVSWIQRRGENISLKIGLQWKNWAWSRPILPCPMTVSSSHFCKIGLLFTYTRIAKLQENMTFGECPNFGHLSHFENTKYFYNTKPFFANTRIAEKKRLQDYLINGFTNRLKNWYDAMPHVTEHAPKVSTRSSYLIRCVPL